MDSGESQIEQYKTGVNGSYLAGIPIHQGSLNCQFDGWKFGVFYSIK